jgi:hypothetical protein
MPPRSSRSTRSASIAASPLKRCAHPDASSQTPSGGSAAVNGAAELAALRKLAARRVGLDDAEIGDQGTRPGERHKGGAADKVVSKLLRDGLIEEIPARGALPIWRRDEDKEAVALRITKRGLAAIGVDEHRAVLEAEENNGTGRSTDPACNKPARRASAVRRNPCRGIGVAKIRRKRQSQRHHGRHPVDAG